MKLHLSFFSLLFLSFNMYGQDTLGVLTPDRPGFGDAVFITPKNNVMIETGYWTENQKEAGAIHSIKRGIGLNSTLLRYGVSKKMELRFDYSIWQEKSDNEAYITGFQPARIGVKVALIENKGAIPAVTLIGMTGFPFSTSKVFRSKYINPSMELSFANPLTDWLTLCYNLGAAWDGENSNPAYYYALSLEMSLSDKFGCYIQGHGDSRKTDLPGDIKQLKQSFAEGGIVFYPKKYIQLDISAGSSMGTANTYTFLTFGCCVRIPK